MHGVIGLTHGFIFCDKENAAVDPKLGISTALFANSPLVRQDSQTDSNRAMSTRAAASASLSRDNSLHNPASTFSLVSSKPEKMRTLMNPRVYTFAMNDHERKCYHVPANRENIRQRKKHKKTKLDDGRPESEKAVFQLALSMLVVKNSR